MSNLIDALVVGHHDHNACSRQLYDCVVMMYVLQAGVLSEGDHLLMVLSDSLVGATYDQVSHSDNYILY